VAGRRTLDVRVLAADPRSLGRLGVSSTLDFRSRWQVQTLRWGICVVATVMAIWAANSAAFHSWASWGPPTPHPEVHARWSRSLAIASMALLVLAASVFFFLRPRTPKVDET